MVDVSVVLEVAFSVPDTVDGDDGSIALVGISSQPDTVDHDSSIAMVGFSSALGTVGVTDGECKVGVHEGVSVHALVLAFLVSGIVPGAKGVLVLPLWDKSQ